MNHFETHIVEYLKVKGHALGNDLNKSLHQEFGIQQDHGRKIIQRAVQNELVYSSSPVAFGKGQFIYALEPKFWDIEMIRKIAKIQRPPLYRLISIMESNGGIISYYEALKIASAPLDGELVKTDTLQKLISELDFLGIAKIVSDKRGINYFIFIDQLSASDILMARQYGRMKTDAMFVSKLRLREQ
jgi:hypothetical protein